MSDSEPNAQLDYAFVAEWAKLNENSTLTAIGASFLRVSAPIGATVSFAVAGRIRLRTGVRGATLALEITLPGAGSRKFEMVGAAGPDVEYGGGKSHLMFAMPVSAQIGEYGQAVVTISVDGVRQRELRFDLIDPNATAPGDAS
ncbi:hypothetical protein [Naumannella huperziae]